METLRAGMRWALIVGALGAVAWALLRLRSGGASAGVEAGLAIVCGAVWSAAAVIVWEIREGRR
jgi:hypothetical protein